MDHRPPSATPSTAGRGAPPGADGGARRLGDVLLSLDLLEAEQLDEVLAVQARGGGRRIGRIALELGYLDAEGLARALAVRHGLQFLPAARVARLGVAPEVLGRAPAPLLRERLLVPLQHDARRGVLTVLTADPTDRAGLRALRIASGARLRVFVAADDAVRRLVTRLLPSPEPVYQHEEPPGLLVADAQLVICLEPDGARAAALQALEALENTTTVVLRDPAAIAPLLRSARTARVYYRRRWALRIEPLLPAWRAAASSLTLVPVERWSDRPPLPPGDTSAFFLDAWEAALLAAEPPAYALETRRLARLVRGLASELELPEELRELVRVSALLLGPDRPAPPPWALRSPTLPPWSIDAFRQALARRESGGEAPGGDGSAWGTAVELLAVARATVRLGVADEADPADALGAEGLRFHGEVVGALARELARGALRRRLAQGAGRDASVLLAVVDPVERVAAEGHLQAAGHEVVTVEDGATALTWARTRPFGVVVVDQRLPPREGLGVLGDLARDRGARELPSILLVDPDEPRIVRRAYELGVADVVERPLLLLDLADRVRAQLDRQRTAEVVVPGRLEVLDLHALVATLAAGAHTARVVVAAPGAHGEVYLREGRVVRCALASHAEATAVDAPLDAFGPLREGGFEVHFGEEELVRRARVVQSRA